MTKISVEKELNRAKFHEKKGEFIEASNIYENILKIFPKNLRVKKKLETLKIPKQINPVHPPQGVIDSVVKLFNQKHYSLAVDQAHALTKQFPDSFIVWNILGVANKGLGKIVEASESFKKVVKLNPNLPDGFNNLAMAQQALGKLDEALDLSEKALLLKNDSHIFHTNNGIILQEQGKFNESLDAFKKALSFNSKYFEAYYSMANTFLFQDKKDEAIKYFKKTVLLNPNYAQAYFNMAVVFKEQGKFDESFEACNKAIFLQPDHAEAYNNLSVVLKEQGKLDEAIEASNKAISLQPDQAEAYYNLSFFFNLKGDIQKGLKLYEWRLKKKKFSARIPRDHLIWDGNTSISEKNFFVYREQGLGDTIQFCRYLPMLKQKGSKVIFKVQKKMHALLRTLDEDIILVDSDPDVNNIDFETPLMSLPYLFNTTLNTIPFKNSYLSAEHNKVISWSKLLTKATFKIGICWQGSKSRVDVGRSFSLALFEDISKLPNIELISLHKGEGEKQIKNINFNLTVLGEDFDSGADAFIDTAAVITNCDLIITSDTAIAHLAGALGCCTWVILKKVPDWRWMLERSDSPWYPNMKLYRQKEYDNWEDVFEIIQKDLESIIKLKEN